MVWWLYALIGFIVILVFLGWIAPSSYHVFRQIEVNRPKSEVFHYLKYLKNQDDWSPWSGKDLEMLKTYSGIDGTVGFISAWKGNKEVGEGEQEITNILEGERIDTQLRFLKPWKSQSDAYLKLNESTANKTRVTWGFTGKNKFLMSIMMLFMNMDKMIGNDFDQGLSKLKEVLEPQESEL
ncbi:MAG: SRPBCC family protein [Flavobacteriaceae bacterium]|nr:SRPBCC family protein [Flavobacteriaceae bacterium]